MTTSIDLTEAEIEPTCEEVVIRGCPDAIRLRLDGDDACLTLYLTHEQAKRIVASLSDPA